MDELVQRAEIILRIYYERSVKALELLEKDRLEEAIKLLKLREAAFHNLKVVIFLAEKKSLDIFRSPQLVDIYNKQEILDQKLLPMVEGQKDKMQVLAGRLSEARRKITGYHSGVKDEGTVRHVA